MRTCNVDDLHHILDIAGLQANFDVMSWTLSDEDFRQLCSLNCQMRMVNGSFWLHPRGPYKTLHDLWDESEDAEE